MAAQPEGAQHRADICPFCVDKAARSTASWSLPASAGPDVSSSQSTKGGTTRMTDISQEAHEALVRSEAEKAVGAAVKTTEQAVAIKTSEAETATKRVSELETELASVKADNDRLNGKLNKAQVSLKASTEENENLKKAAQEAEEAAKLSEIAGKRTEQVKALGLFPDDYVGDKASKWASFSDEDWAGQLAEWQQLKPAAANGQSAAAAGDENPIHSGSRAPRRPRSANLPLGVEAGRP